MKNSTIHNRQQRRSEKNLLRAVDYLLVEAASGGRRLSPAELKQCSEILNASRPPVFFVQHVLVNAYAFLTEFPAEPNERAAIERFLVSFQQQAADDLAGNNGTLKDSITLQQAGDPI